ncbi:MAG: radical SAM protein [Armatimonadota bacterium]
MKITVIEPYNMPYAPRHSSSLINAYIYSFLKKYACEFKFIDCGGIININPFDDNISENQVRWLEEVVFLAEKEKPDIVLFNYKTLALPFINEVSLMIKQILPDAVTVLGGSSLELAEELIDLNFAVDYFLVGDIELTLKIFLDDFKNKSLENIIYGCGEVKNLDSVTPSFDLYENSNLELLPYDISRGCAFNCEFCTKSGSRFRNKSVGKVVCDLKKLKEKYKVRQIGFVDEFFNFDRKYLYEFCSEIRKNTTGVDFACNWVLNEPIDFELIKELKAAGLKCVAFSIESFPGREFSSAEFYDKQYLFEYLKESIIKIKKLNIAVMVNILTNSYNDTRESFELVDNFIKDVTPHAELYIGQVLLLPPSPLWRLYKKGGMKIIPRAKNDFPVQKEHPFSKKYRETVIFSPQYWMVDNKYIYPDIKRILKYEDYLYIKQREPVQNRYSYIFTGGDLKARVKSDKYISALRVNAAQRKAVIYKDFYLKVQEKVDVLIDDVKMGEFYLDKGLSFDIYDIKLEHMIEAGRHTIEFAAKQDNVFVDKMELITKD